MVNQLSSTEHAGNNFKYRLRNVTVKDSDYIYKLRTDPHNAKYINDTKRDVHDSWMKKYLSGSQDYYFAIVGENNGKATGFVSLYNIENHEAEWGRWVVDKNPIAAIESLILIHDFGFKLGLRGIYSKTKSENLKVVGLHRNLPYSSITEIDEDDSNFVMSTVLSEDFPDFVSGIMKRLRYN